VNELIQFSKERFEVIKGRLLAVSLYLPHRQQDWAAGGWVNVLITDADAARQLLEPPQLAAPA
jgi:hypothetical protein